MKVKIVKILDLVNSETVKISCDGILSVYPSSNASRHNTIILHKLSKIHSTVKSELRVSSNMSAKDKLW